MNAASGSSPLTPNLKPLDIKPHTCYISNMNAMTRSYLETLIWSETIWPEVEGGTFEWEGCSYREGDSLDNLIEAEDLPKSIVEQAKEDCAGFVSYVEETLGFDVELHFDSKSVGHNFLLSRNGHGAGFFDGLWEVEGVNYNRKLQEAAETFGTIGLQVWVENDELKIESHG